MAEKSNMARFKQAQAIRAVLIFVFLLLGCEDFERDNPYYKNGINYDPSLFLKSSSSGGSGSGYTGSYGSLPYEGKTYKTVVIGTQTWMAENLNYNADGSVCYGNERANWYGNRKTSLFSVRCLQD